MTQHTYAISKDLSIDDKYKNFILTMNNTSFKEEALSRMSTENYNKMWFVIVQGTQSQIIETSTIKNIFKLITRRYPVISQGNDIVNFLDGFTFFVNNQKKFNNKEISSLINGNSLFVDAIKNEQYHLLDTLAQYRTTNRYPEYQDAMNEFMKNKERDKVNAITPYLTGLNTNNSEILRLCYQNNFYYFDIIKNIIDTYKLDINSTGTTGHVNPINQKSQTKSSFVHLVFSDASEQNKKNFFEFLNDYGKKIDLDSKLEYIQKISDYHSEWRSENVISVLWGSNINLNQKLDKLNAVLKQCNITEKQISQITNLLFSSSITSSYSHEVFDTLFSHKEFQSKNIDKSTILLNLLDVDKLKEVKDYKDSNKEVTNPVKILVEKLFRYNPEIKTDKNPFIHWALNNKNFSLDTFEYLFSKYERDIRALPLKAFETIPGSIKDKLIEKNVSGLKKTNFFSRLFSSNIVEASPVIKPEIKQELFEYVTKLEFKDNLLDRVEDKEMQFFINSIKLNTQQFEAFHDGQITKNSHYMLNLLPSFLNKTVELYLSLYSIEPVEAKENILPQLKLLNKKSVDILHEILNDEKQAIQTKVDIQKKVFKNY